MTKQERAARTRHALVKSAAAAFGACGYAEATLNMISAGAGVSAGALHFHFENKAAVGLAVEGAAARALRGLAADVYAARKSGLQALTDTSYALAQALRTDQVVRAGFRLGREAAFETSCDLRGEWRRHVGLLLAEAAEEGTLLPGVSLRDAVAVVVAATTGLEVLGRDDPEWISHRSLTGFWRVVLPCLAAPEALDVLGAGAGPPGPGPGPGIGWSRDSLSRAGRRGCGLPHPSP
ncbi:ScbR family autoregulator-binding transcription factor [Streptomyces sp. NPDC048603]|uniref:ScbR family autoregulator-binding transcription factor n=1 Tax=Streptomyces sp. NPDC048603 TaxID=3365577 RepID=UPI003715FD58